MDGECGGDYFYNWVEWTLSRYFQSLPSILIAYFVFGKPRVKKLKQQEEYKSNINITLPDDELDESFDSNEKSFIE